MDLQSLLTELGDEKSAVVMAAIEAEKNRGISESRKKGDEVKRHLTEANRLKDALKNTLGFDEIPGDADLSELIAEKLRTHGSKEKETELTKVRREIDSMKKLLADKDAKEQSLQRELNFKTISSTLGDKMKDQFHGYDFIIKDLISSGKVKINDNSEVAFLDGDSEIDILQGIETLKKQRPDLVRNTQSPGGSSAGVKQRYSNQKTMSSESFNQLPAKDRAKFMADGGQLT